MGDHRIDLDFAIHVPVDDLWHVRSPLGPPKCSAFPDTASYQLERTGRNFCSSGGYADDDAFAPAFMCSLQSGTHDLGIARRIEGIVGTALGKFYQMSNHVTLDLGGIDEICHAKVTAGLFLVIIQIDTDNLVCPGKTQPLDNIQADSAEAEDHATCADLDFGGVNHRANARCDTASNVAYLVKGCILAHLGQRDFRDHCVVGKGRAPHIVMDRRPIEHRKTRGSVGQQTLALSNTDRLAQVRLAREAVFALAAFRCIQWNNVIADFQRCDTFAYLKHDACAFMPQNGGKDAFGVVTRTGEFVGVAKARGLDLDKNFTFAWAFKIDLHDF